MKRSVTLLGVLAGMVALIPTSLVGDTHSEQDRLQNAGKVMKEVLNIPDDIPTDLLNKARCVVVMPSVLKAAFIVGGSYGRGAMVCRTGKNFKGPWGAPAMYALEGGNFGLQAGGEATDYVFLVINDRGVDSLLHSKVKLGADVSVAGGPKGRTASADTDAFMRSEILTYSRAACLPALRWKVRLCGPTTAAIVTCMGARLLQPRSFGSPRFALLRQDTT